MPYHLSNYQLEIIGTGLQVPDSFNDTSGRVNYNTGGERIDQAIKHILGTPVGLRYFVPEFGSRIHELIFEPNDYILRDMLILYVNEALTRWEPRIKVLEVNPVVIKYQNEVPINIMYNLVNTNSVYNYVYPFNRQVYELSSYDDKNIVV